MKARTLSQTGFTLIEVLIGILIFALGMMALAQLQGNLSKSSADANARTVALNIAEETVESLRSFSQVTASNDVDAFNNIVSGTAPVSRGGLDYTVTSVVTDYYYHPDGTFQTFKPDPDIVNADLKRLELTVSWGAPQSFQIDQDKATTNLGTGSVTVTDLISSFTIASGAKTVLNGASGLYSPPVDYNPGENPDIISIQLGQNKFKESTTPLPDVVRADELVETRFDVVTYSQDTAGATFLRREEFRAVSCACTLRLPTTATEGGLRPTIWDGNEYTVPEWVSKPYGESANNQQSIYCELCCRDHHDGGVGENDSANDTSQYLYSPFFRSVRYHSEGALAGDHKHYNRDRNGQLVLAENDGDLYLEACRMVRKDGFFRIAQNLRQEGLNAFPGDYLDDQLEVSAYSNYVTGAISAYESLVSDGYERALDRPELPSPSPGQFPASTTENPTQMISGGTVEQQLRSRGIYIDYMSDKLRWRINCLDIFNSGETCNVPGATSALEIIPFYDVQLTWLSRWTETPTNEPIDVTNEAIQNDNAHSRGIATLETGDGAVIINSAVHTGNLGLTGTDPIDPAYSFEEESYDLHAFAGEITDGPPPEDTGYIVSGKITSAVGGVKAADVEMEASDASCDRTNTGFECVVGFFANNPRVKVFNYFKTNKVLFACSPTLSVHGTEHSGTNPVNNWTNFNLPMANVTADIVIKENSCN